MANKSIKLELIREGKKKRLNWYWFNDSLLTPKGNWRKSPDGTYFDQIKGRTNRIEPKCSDDECEYCKNRGEKVF